MGATLYLITNPLLLLTTLYRACSNSISRTRKRRPAGRPSLLAPPVANYLDPGSRKPEGEITCHHLPFTDTYQVYDKQQQHQKQQQQQLEKEEDPIS